MSVRSNQFGTIQGTFDQDIRLQISGPGRKGALAIIASYQIHRIDFSNSILTTGQQSYAIPPHGADPAFPAVAAGAPVPCSCWGRLTLFDGFVDPNGEVNALTPNDELGKIIFDCALPGPGPHKFLFPLADLLPGPRVTNTLTLILAAIPSQLGPPPVFFAPILVTYGNLTDTGQSLSVR